MSPGHSARPPVVVDRVTKRFTIPHERRDTLKERALHPVRRVASSKLDALKDVSFQVEPGEFFGIVGRNGSGKSTLLKCLAGIYRVDDGRIYVNGRLSTFIELGVGFHPDMVARDNVVINGVMLGLTPREARERVEPVIDFAGLREFEDLKLKNYSSGMQVRLAFAVMVQVNADIFLVDEILAVGDAAFQQRCFDVFSRIREERKTVIFVSHDLTTIERFCHRTLLLDRGEIVAIGKPKAVADRYLDMSLGEDHDFGQRGGEGSARVVEAWMEDEQGVRQAAFAHGRPCTFKAQVRFERPVTDPAFAVAFVNPHLQNVFVATSASDSERTGRFEAGETITFSVSFENALAPGRYSLSTLVSQPGAGEPVLDRWERIFSVVVTGERTGGGLVDLPHDLRIERATAGAGVGERL